MKWDFSMKEERFGGSIDGYLGKEVNNLKGNIEEKSINNIKIVFFLVNTFVSSSIYVALFLLVHHVDSYILKTAYSLLHLFSGYSPSIIDSSRWKERSNLSNFVSSKQHLG